MVNSEKMLPDFVREMYPMKEILNAEDTLLFIIEKVIFEMIEDSKIVILNRINVETVNKLVNDLTQCASHVEETPEELIIRVVIQRDFKLSFNFKRLSSNLNLLMPAHLKIIYENQISMDSRHYIGISGNKISSTGSQVILISENMKKHSAYIGIVEGKCKTMEGAVR